MAYQIARPIWPRQPFTLYGLRSSDNLLALRVATEPTVAEVEGVGAATRLIHQTINVATKPTMPGKANGNIWQRPRRFGFRPAAVFVWYMCVGHTSDSARIPCHVASRAEVLNPSIGRGRCVRQQRPAVRTVR